MKLVRLLLPTAILAATLALPARAETHVSIDLGLRLGAPPPIVVREAPPRPVVVDTRYAAPGSGYVWVAGHNSWRNGRWVWMAGAWVRPPQPNVIYVEGRWDERSRNWIESHWEVAVPTPLPPGPEYVIEAPPPPRQEVIIAQPGPGYVWIGGYWGWHHHRHEWVAGHWERPPHGHHEWAAARWEHHGNSYVLIEGQWR